MAHIRHRFAVELLKRKLKFAPVVAIQGVRQCGKSTLARDLLPKQGDSSVYRTFDFPSVLDSFSLRPESFLENMSDAKPLILDEAQKAPKLFDVIKGRVDLDRRPGQYLLLGSTEFSKAMKIREALTGRLSRVRLFPMTLAEMHELTESTSKNSFFLSNSARISRKDFLRNLNSGCMPGIFATRNGAERDMQIQDWIELTLERDAHQIPMKKVNSVILRRVLREICINLEPESGRIAKSLRLSSATVKSYIDILKTLFVIHEIHPHSKSTGKPRYYLCDPAIAASLGASFDRQLETLFYLEQLAKLSYFDTGKISLTYYRTTKGSVIHGVWEGSERRTSLIKLLPTESMDSRDLFSLEAAELKKFKGAELLVLYGGRNAQNLNRIQCLPWEFLC
jgi:predicted AAA+ superfamily ATPase